MSIPQKCADYAVTHGGELPSFKEMDELVSKQLREYLDKLTIAVVPEFNDRAIITAAYKLLYEARYNMLEPADKAFCNRLVQSARVISTERTVQK